MVQQHFGDDETILCVAIGDGVCAPFRIHTVDDQHVFEVAERTSIYIEEVARIQGSLVPIHFIQFDLDTRAFEFLRREGFGQQAALVRHIGVEQPEIVWIEIRAYQTRILQDGNRKRTADVAGCAITGPVDLFAQDAASITGLADVFDGSTIHVELLFQAERSDLRKVAALQQVQHCAGEGWG